MDDTRKAFVLGLDGVPWSFIEKWADEDTLPNFARLVEEGAAAPMRSTVPASTPLAWPSIATGVWPDKHGIYGFQRLTEGYTNRMYTNDDLQQPPLWELQSPSVVVNVPMTYPASEIDGSLVASIMSPEIDERYTHPSSLARRIRREIPDYEIALRWHEYVNDQDALFEDITTVVEARRELMHDMLDEDWELFFYTFMEPDRLQHLVWDEELLLEHYEQLDEILGEILDHLETVDANLFVVSDHGFGSVSRSVGVNRLLERQGYLSRDSGGESGSGSLLARAGVDKDSIDSLFDRFGVDHHALLKKYAPQEVIEFLGSAVPGDHALYDVDHSETTAFVHEFGSVYVNDTERFDEGTVSPREVDGVKEELTDLFAELTDPETGEQPLEVFDGDELFPTDHRSPDLVVEPGPEYVLSNGLEADVFGTPSANASHRPDGIFLAWGPDVAAGSEPADATVVDVAPTVLHSIGAAVPDHVDGTVLSDIFRSESAPGTDGVETADYDERTATAREDEEEEDMDEVKDRLQGLGYLE
jgi:predicted AlkP superfamily phosphohydrolase/phosphomutase